MNPHENDQPTAEAAGIKGPFKYVFIAIAFIAAIFIKPAQYLKREAYEKATIGGFARLVGYVLSIGASIGTGYLALQHGTAIKWWVSAAVVAPFATYYYLWPLAFLGVGKWAFKFSNYLWDRVVDVDDSDSHGPKWFSMFLGVVLQVAVVAGGCWAWWELAHKIHTFLDWGAFGWVIGVVGGGALAFLGGALVTAGIWQVGMRVVAFFIGLAMTYFFGFDLSAHLPQFLAHYLGGHSTGVRYFGQALQFGLFFAYIFPLGHVIISHMFGWVGKYFKKLLENTYNDKDTNYVGFVGEVVNICATVVASYFAFGYASTFGFGLWLAVPATAVAALVSYLIGGALLRVVGNIAVGIVFCTLSALAVAHFGAAYLPYGVAGKVVAGLFAFSLNAVLVGPLLYQLIKLVANPLVASWLGKPLTELYKTISSEVFTSLTKTYDDDTAYGPLFLHVVNIAFAVGVFLALHSLVPLLHLTPWLAVSLTPIITLASYLFIARLLLAYKTKLIGIVLSIAVGAFVGVEVFVHFHHNWWYAGISFVVAFLGFVFGVFPVTYVVARAALEVIHVSKWAKPVVEGVYNFLFSFVQKGWNQFLIAYKHVSISFAPIWANVSKTWDESWAAAKVTFDNAFNSKKKK